MEMKKIYYTIIGLTLFIISLIFDKEILNFTIQNRISFLNIFFIWVTYIGHQLSVFLISTSIFTYKKKYKNLIYLWITLATAFIATYLIKYIIQRQRPLVEMIIERAGYSFPSSHAAVIFSVIPIINKEVPKLKYVWIIFAFLVLFSRVYLGMHYPSDVIAGAILGYLTGTLILYIQDRNLTNIWKMK